MRRSRHVHLRETRLALSWLAASVVVAAGGMADRRAIEYDWALGDGLVVEGRLQIEAVLRPIDELGVEAGDLRGRHAALTRAGAASDDPRWRALYVEACERRRAARLGPDLEGLRRVVFTKHFDLGGSHYAYTEAQSDAQHERNWQPGSALCLLEMDGVDGRVRTLLEDPGGVDGRVRTLLAADPDVSCNQPVPLVPRPRPPLRPSSVDYEQTTGTFYVQDVYRGPGLAGVPRGTVTRLRVVALDFRPAGIRCNFSEGVAGGALASTPVSVGNGCWDPKIILGDATVYEDGSAWFTVPARNGTMQGQPNRLVDWIGVQSAPPMLPPYAGGAATSDLVTLLEAGHAGIVLSRQEWETVCAWIDLLVPYCGDYAEASAWTVEERQKYDHFVAKRRRMETIERQNLEALAHERRSSGTRAR